MIKQLRALFLVPTHKDIAHRELLATRRALLVAHAECEDCEADLRSFKAHIDLLNARLRRLEAYCANTAL